MNKNIIIILAVGLGGFLFGKYSAQPEERVVEKVVYTEGKKEEQKNVKTFTREYLAKCDPASNTVPIKETSTEDLSKITTDVKKQEQLSIKEVNKKQWLAGGGIGYNLKGEQVFSGELSTRVFNLPVFVGGQVIGNQSNQMGLIKLTVEF